MNENVNPGGGIDTVKTDGKGNSSIWNNFISIVQGYKQSQRIRICRIKKLFKGQ